MHNTQLNLVIVEQHVWNAVLGCSHDKPYPLRLHTTGRASWSLGWSGTNYPKHQPECKLTHVFSRAPRGKPSKIPENPKSPASLPQTYPRAVSLPSWAPSIDWELPARLRASAALRRSFQCLSAIFEGYLPNTCLDATVVFPESLSGRGSGKPACLLSNADRKEPPQHWYRRCVAGDGWSGGHTAYYLAACHRGSTLCVPGLTFLSHLHATFSRSLRCSPEWDNKQARDP